MVTDLSAELQNVLCSCWASLVDSITTDSRDSSDLFLYAYHTPDDSVPLVRVRAHHVRHTWQIFSDNVCPWCFVGKRNLESAMKQYTTIEPKGAEFDVRWKPFFLNVESPETSEEPIKVSIASCRDVAEHFAVRGYWWCGLLMMVWCLCVLQSMT